VAQQQVCDHQQQAAVVHHPPHVHKPLHARLRGWKGLEDVGM
jgi:hypothetical protein